MGGGELLPVSYLARSQYLRDHGHEPGSPRWARTMSVWRALDHDAREHARKRSKEAAARATTEGRRRRR